MKGSVIRSGAEVGIFDGHIIQGGSAVGIYDGYKISGGAATKIYQNADCKATNFYANAIRADGSIDFSMAVDVVKQSVKIFRLHFYSPVTTSSIAFPIHGNYYWTDGTIISGVGECYIQNGADGTELYHGGIGSGSSSWSVVHTVTVSDIDFYFIFDRCDHAEFVCPAAGLNIGGVQVSAVDF